MKMTDNGVRIDVPVFSVKRNFQDVEGLRAKEGVSVVGISRNGVDHTVISPVLSSAASTESSSLLSVRELDVYVTEDGDQSKTISPIITLYNEITLPSMLGVSLPSDVTRILGNIESIMTSTPASVKSTSGAILQSAPTWSAEEIGAVVIIIFMVPFILLSNIVVILSVVRFRRLHTPTNYFIISLAAVDIFVALATPFGIVVEVFHFGSASRSRDVVVCLIPNRVLMMACGVSVLTLAAIAYDRHTALVSPLEYVNIMTSRKVAIMVALTWMYSVAIVWMPLTAGWYDVPANISQCSANLIHGKAPLLFLSAIFVPSCVAILVCYFRIFMVARHHAKAIAAVEFALYRRLQVKFMIKDTKYAKTLALVIGVFLALWLPYLICIFLKTVSSVKFDIWVQTYLILLAVFNSGINPWIYAFRNNELKSAFKRLFVELCKNRLCPSLDSRASLLSAVNGTPRLSLSDSRMISIIPEVTSDKEGDNGYQNPLGNQTGVEDILPSSCISGLASCGKPVARSCSLDYFLDDDKICSAELVRSFSMDIIANNGLGPKSTKIDTLKCPRGPILNSTYSKPVFHDTLTETNSIYERSLDMLPPSSRNTRLSPPSKPTPLSLTTSLPLKLPGVSSPRLSKYQSLHALPLSSSPFQHQSARPSYPSISTSVNAHHPQLRRSTLPCFSFIPDLQSGDCPRTATFHTHHDQLLIHIDKTGSTSSDSKIISQTTLCPITSAAVCWRLPTVIETRNVDVASGTVRLQKSLDTFRETNGRTQFICRGQYV